MISLGNEKEKNMTRWTLRIGFVLAILCVVAAAPSSAQAFKAEIDCNGLHSPGDTVNYLVEFEEQAFDTHDLDVTIAVNVPGAGSITIRETGLILGPNVDLFFQSALALPAGAPNGNYQMTITATEPGLTSFDTCSFNVN